MSDFARALEQIHQSMPTSRAQIRRDADVVEMAISSGVSFTRDQTDEGLHNEADCRVRFKASDEPETWAASNAIQGKRVDARFYDGTAWGTWGVFRVERRVKQGNVVYYELISEWAR